MLYGETPHALLTPASLLDSLLREQEVAALAATVRRLDVPPRRLEGTFNPQLPQLTRMQQAPTVL